MNESLVEILTRYRPSFAHADWSRVRMWQEQGCDMERDIIPAVKATIARKHDIGSLAYFDAPVRKARDMRMVSEQKAEPPTPQTEEAKAKKLAYIIRKLGRRMPTEERWLKEYEQLHGKVL